MRSLAPYLPASGPRLMPLVVPVFAFRWVFIGVILISSIQTLIGAAADPHIAALAAAEIAGALAFATPRWRRAGTLLLCLVFAIAFALSAAAGEFAPRFFLFAATAVYLAGLDEPRPAHRSPN
jgi:hypothetical protein